MSTNEEDVQPARAPPAVSAPEFTRASHVEAAAAAAKAATEAQAAAQEQLLARIAELAAPFFKNYLEAEDRKHQRDTELTREEIRAESERLRRLTRGAFTLAFMVISITALLFAVDKDAAGQQFLLMISLIFGGAGFANLARGSTTPAQKRSGNEE